MSKSRRMWRLLRGNMSYANVMATAAVFVALGGGAYAAAVLPRDSVGQAQLRMHAVARSELAPGAVSRAKLAGHAVNTRQLARGAVTASRLSKAVRTRLNRRAAPGPQGAKGDIGPPGPAGADALGARRLRFDAVATTNPTASTVLDMPGLRLQATCALNGNDVAVGLRALAPENTFLQSTATIDFGADPATPPGPNIATTNNQSTLVANTDTDLGGPSTENGAGYVRVVATGIAAGQTRTSTLNLVEIVNADTGRCSIDGTALPSS